MKSFRKEYRSRGEILLDKNDVMVQNKGKARVGKIHNAIKNVISDRRDDQ